jgi:hypothetical protein
VTFVCGARAVAGGLARNRARRGLFLWVGDCPRSARRASRLNWSAHVPAARLLVEEPLDHNLTAADALSLSLAQLVIKSFGESSKENNLVYENAVSNFM